jgi:DNA-directed RNA polymerase specialized sigma24 family protein
MTVDQEPDKPPKGATQFADFVRASELNLLRALVSHHGPEIGREALADAYAYAWQHWERVSIAENLVGYVFRAADRIGAQRAMKARREAPDGTADRDLEWVDADHHPEIVAALRRLPPRQRGAVLLVHGYGYTYKEAARTLDIPVSTLTNEVFRGLQRLRQIATSPSCSEDYR